MLLTVMIYILPRYYKCDMNDKYGILFLRALSYFVFRFRILPLLMLVAEPLG